MSVRDGLFARRLRELLRDRGGRPDDGLRRRLRRSGDGREQLLRLQQALRRRRQLRRQRLLVRGRRNPLRYGVRRHPKRHGQLRKLRPPLRRRHAVQRGDLHRHVQHRRGRDALRRCVRRSRYEQSQLRIVRRSVPGRRALHQRDLPVPTRIHPVCPRCPSARGRGSLRESCVQRRQLWVVRECVHGSDSDLQRRHLRDPMRRVGFHSVQQCVRRSENNKANCGLCSDICGSNLICQNGGCACPSGTVDCAGTCSDLQTDGNDCGSCGTQCGSGQGCVSGACR